MADSEFSAEGPASPRRPRRESDVPARRPRPRRPRRDEEDDYEDYDDPVSTLIPFKNPKALLAYYCGVFGLIPVVGLFLGTAALIFGILGLQYKKEHPQAKGSVHAIAAIVLGSLELLVHIALVGFILIVWMASRK